MGPQDELIGDTGGTHGKLLELDMHAPIHSHVCMYILHIYMCVVVCTFGLARGGTSDKICTAAPGGANVLVSTVHDVFVCACVCVCVCVRA